MKLQDVKIVLKAALKAKRPVFLWGNKGNAKTQGPKQFAQEMGWNYKSIYLGQTADVADILGLPYQLENGTFKHSRPAWYPESGRWIIHLDEFNRCHPDIVQSMLSFVQTGVFHEHKGPEELMIIAGGNYDNGNYITTNIKDDALLSRFLHLEVELGHDEWLKYAEEQGVSNTVLSFIRNNPEFLANTDKGGFKIDFMSPDPRVWLEAISPFEKDSSIDHVRFEVYSGLVGTVAAQRFIADKAKQEERLDYKLILEDYSKVQDKVKFFSRAEDARLDQLNVAMEDILIRIEDEKYEFTSINIDNIKKFLLDCPVELTYKAVERIAKSNFVHKDAIINDEAYVANFEKAKTGKKKKAG